MRKRAFLVVASACVGAMGAAALTRPRLQPEVRAQESPAPRRAWGGQYGFDPPAERGAVSAAADADAQEQFTLEERINIAVYEQVNRSVVHITTRSVRPDSIFFSTAMEGDGSGSVLDKNGHILTNQHVVEGANEIRVTLFNGDTGSAAVVGQDPDTDTAVLKIDAPPETLYPVTLGDSTRLKVGQKVYAIGNPFGLDRTLTVGIISSLNRSLPSSARRTIKSVIQIDAALNRGNSGGPLLDSRGRLIGMNTAIASMTGENTGVGFAIPVNTIRRVVKQLIEIGRVIRPDIGITRVLVTDEGLIIVTLAPGGPAEQAGLRGFRVVRRQKKKGLFVYEETYIEHRYADLIVAVDGQKVASVDDFLTTIESKQPGEKVVVTVVRGTGQANVVVTLGIEQ